MTNYNSFLKIEKTISLPIAVDTNAILTPWNDNLFILINSVAKKETLMFRLNNSFNFEKITTLPLLSTSAIICKDQMFISGSDNKGKPLILIINISGEILQKTPLEITPSIWPILGCSEKMYVAWQEKPNEIKYGTMDFNNSEIEKIQSIAVENPPANLYAIPKSILAGISEKSKTIVMDLITKEQYSLNIAQPITVGQAKEDIYFGWTEGDTVCLKFQNSEEKYCVAAKNANSGKLKAVSGTVASLWLQKQVLTIDGDYQWESSIIQKDVEIFEINSFIHTVGGWNEILVAVQNSKIIILKKQSFNR